MTLRQNSTGTAFFGSLEALRGVAALLVVFFHMPCWHESVYRFDLVRYGGLSVNFFFVLSGFVLYHSYAGRLESQSDLPRFVVQRLGRIYPVHLLFLLAFLGVEVFKYVLAARMGTARMSAEPFSQNDWGAFVEHLFLIQAFTGNEATFNFPSWSISTEFYTYLIFALAVTTLSARAFVWTACIVAAGSMTLLVTHHAALAQFGMMFRCVGGFFLGCATCVAFRRATAAAWKPNWIVLVGAAVASLWLFDWDSPTIHPAVLVPSALLIFALVIAPDSSVNRVLSLAPLLWLGKISYSLYMSHALVIWFAKQVSRSLFRDKEILVDGSSGWLLPLPAAIAIYTGTIAAALAAGFLTHRYVEEPLRKASRRWGSERLATAQS